MALHLKKKVLFGSRAVAQAAAKPAYPDLWKPWPKSQAFLSGEGSPSLKEIADELIDHSYRVSFKLIFRHHYQIARMAINTSTAALMNRVDDLSEMLPKYWNLIAENKKNNWTTSDN